VHDEWLGAIGGAPFDNGLRKSRLTSYGPSLRTEGPGTVPADRHQDDPAAQLEDEVGVELTLRHIIGCGEP